MKGHSVVSRCLARSAAAERASAAPRWMVWSATLSRRPLIPFLLLLPPSCMTPLAVSSLQKYFCCAVLSCSLSYNYLFSMCDFNMQTNSLDQTKCSPVFVKEKQIMGDFMAFSCKTGSFHRSPEPAWDGCPSGSRSFLKECIWLSSCSL